MDLGAYQLQIFLSLFVVLGAAFVALVCDLLKGNNEQLRELNLELRIRREEEQKRFDMLLAEKAPAQVKEAPPVVAVPVPAVVEVRAERNGRPPRLERKRAPAQEALAAMERGVQMASMRRRPRTTESVPAPIEVEERPAEVATVEQVMEHVIEHVAEHVMESISVRAAELPAALSVPPAAQVHAPAATSTRDWSSLLNRRATTSASKSGQASAPARNDLLEAVVAATDSTAPSQSSTASLPAGFQDGYVLSRLVERRQPVSGLVVSIGLAAQEKDHDAATAETIPGLVRSLVESLMGPGDFAAQAGNEEYLVIYPGIRGAAAQRRLSDLAQQLWDFQLRSMGQFSVQFSWGGVEVRSESIQQAIASASERMNETRRGREVHSLPKAG